MPDDLPDRDRWTKLKAIGMTINDTLRGGKASLEMRYYILSKKTSARRFAQRCAAIGESRTGCTGNSM